jgi:hypothetical protein
MIEPSIPSYSHDIPIIEAVEQTRLDPKSELERLEGIDPDVDEVRYPKVVPGGHWCLTFGMISLYS